MKPSKDQYLYYLYIDLYLLDKIKYLSCILLDPHFPLL
jgi:hypothetical protein